MDRSTLISLVNVESIELTEVLFFKESLSSLLIAVLFITLAARIDINGLIAIGWRCWLSCSLCCGWQQWGWRP